MLRNGTIDGASGRPDHSRPATLAPASRGGLTDVVRKGKRFLMARVAEAPNGRLFAIVLGVCGVFFAIIVAVVSWTLVTVLTNSNVNSREISAINARLERMENDIQRLVDDRR